jgi:hypothetical protein
MNVRSRHLLATSCVALLAALGVAAAAAPARAADELWLSSDGTTWSTSLGAALFGTPQTIVPGDVVTSALWVRNASSDPARVDLLVASALGVTPGTLAGDLSLTIDGTPAVGGSRWRGPVLAPGASARIPLVVTFDAASQVTSRLAATSVLDSAILVQVAVGASEAPPNPGSSSSASPNPTGSGSMGAARPPASGSGGLAHTGDDVGRVAVVSFGAIGVGFLLLAARRRSRRDRD